MSEQIAYEELQPGDMIQQGDQWQNADGRWYPLVLTPGASAQVRDGQRARRPHNIAALQSERDEARAEIQTLLQTITEQADQFADAGKTLEHERDEAQKAMTRMKAELANQAEVLAEVRADEERLVNDLDRLRGEYLKVLIERDEARAERDRRQDVVSNLYNEPTARQVQQMLRTWATELDWSAGCFDSVGRNEIDIIQRTMVAVIERIESMLNPEGGTDGE